MVRRCCVNESERRHIIAASQTEIDEIENEERQEEERTSTKERSKFIPLRLSIGERKMLSHLCRVVNIQLM